MTIALQQELYAPAPDKQTTDIRSQRYLHAVELKRLEHRSLHREADWTDADFERVSEDNGRTWEPWKDVRKKVYEAKGEDEILTWDGANTNQAYNPRYGHFVSISQRTTYLDGHEKAMARHWGGQIGTVNHCLLEVRKDGSDERDVELIKYEPGADYDPDNWRDPNYLDRNGACYGSNIDVLDNGEILFPMDANFLSCCRILGVDPKEIFPSCPHLTHGMIVARGTFNEARGNYDLTFSRPVVISDLKSSRGVNESTAMMLPGGRIVAVFRGSNMQSEARNTRIEPTAPGHKWYCWSDDGGQTFTDPVPWHYENREVFYSSSSRSNLLRSIKNGRIYWLGIICDHTANSNQPRYPFIIAEVGERGQLIKDSVTTVDTRREGDSERLCVSDPAILQDRETGLIELYMNRCREHEGFDYWADCHRYVIDVGGERGQG